MSNVAGPIVFLSCVKSKRDFPCAAKDMYISPLFRKTFTYAGSLKPKSIFILSAKYGLLKPDEIIEPYEKTLKSMNTRERQNWADAVLSKLHGKVDLQCDHVIFLAGLPYREGLLPHMRHYDVPMEGLSFGRQLNWLTTRTV